MTDPVLSQLVLVESDLAEQVEQIETQLSQLQAQRQSLKTVINLFQGDGESAAAAPDAPAAAAATKTAATKTAAKSAATKTAAKSAATKTSTPKTVARSTAKSAAKSESKRASTASKSRSTKSTTKRTAGRKKKDGRAAAWQKHVKAEYRDLALPESVSSVLQSQPSEIFKIADVMSSVFKENMPRTAYLKARNRISNILSAGARDGTWYRGSNGRYSQSEKVTKL